MAYTPEFVHGLVEHKPVLEKRALRLTKDPDKAQELVQDTYVRALSKSNTYQPGTNLRAWLLTVENSIFVTGIRRSREPNMVSLEEIGEDSRGVPFLPNMLEAEKANSPLSAEAEFFLQESDRQVETTIQNLDPKHASVIRLIDMEDYSYREASAELGIPEGTVKSRLARGRRNLAKQRKSQ